MKNITIYCFLILVLLSCKKDFLEKEPVGRITDITFFKTENDVTMATNGIYDILHYEGMYRIAAWVLGDIASDNATQYSSGRYEDAFKQVDNFIVSPSNFVLYDRMQHCYAGIFRANTLLDRIDGVSMPENKRIIRKGEALFLRSLMYFNLVTTFGDVPLITKILPGNELLNMGRISKSQVWKQMEDDLIKASDYLPVSYSSQDLGRATKGAALALLGRVYLYQQKWNEAAQYCSDVINMQEEGAQRYDLFSNFNHNFDGLHENGIESVFEIQYISNGPDLWGSNSDGAWTEQFWSPLNGWNFCIPTYEFSGSFEPGDKRKKSTIFDQGDSIYTGAKYDTVEYKGLRVRKMVQNRAALMHSEINWPVIRYAEVLLNYAEALNETNKTGEALVHLNRVRIRAGLNPIPNGKSQTELREIIAHERRMELAFEGHRFFDLTRKGVAGPTMRAKGKPNFKDGVNEIFPIPQQEIDVNKSLIQNTGY